MTGWETPTPEREVLEVDALRWMLQHPNSGPVVTSPPDAEELGLGISAWATWFDTAVERCLLTAGDHPSVFYLSDRKHAGRVISKAAVVLDAASAYGLGLLWHKIVLRRGVGKVNLHRPGFDHLIAVGGPDCRPGQATADVIERGPALWNHGLGTNPARVAAALAAAHSDRLIAPFAGHGTALAAAEEIGLRSIGLELDPARAAIARTSTLPKG